MQFDGYETTNDTTVIHTYTGRSSIFDLFIGRTIMSLKEYPNNGGSITQWSFKPDTVVAQIAALQNDKFDNSRILTAQISSSDDPLEFYCSYRGITIIFGCRTDALSSGWSDNCCIYMVDRFSSNNYIAAVVEGSNPFTSITYKGYINNKYTFELIPTIAHMYTYKVVML